MHPHTRYFPGHPCRSELSFA
jgi:hypothetical protein